MNPHPNPPSHQKLCLALADSPDHTWQGDRLHPRRNDCKAAREVCQSCSVRVWCIAEAMDTHAYNNGRRGEVPGIFGGMFMTWIQDADAAGMTIPEMIADADARYPL